MKDQLLREIESKIENNDQVLLRTVELTGKIESEFENNYQDRKQLRATTMTLRTSIRAQQQLARKLYSCTFRNFAIPHELPFSPSSSINSHLPPTVALIVIEKCYFLCIVIKEHLAASQ